MKLSILITALAGILVSGCAPAGAGVSAVTTTTPGYSDSAPAKMLDTPDRARDAAREANERSKAAQDAIGR